MKKITALSLSSVSFLTFVPSAFALVELGTVNTCPEKFKPLCALGAVNIGTIISSVILILFILAITLALAFLIYGGIKWIISGGDKTKVEAARGTIVAALVGLVLAFLSYFIINLVLNFLGITLDQSFVLPSIGINQP